MVRTVANLAGGEPAPCQVVKAVCTWGACLLAFLLVMMVQPPHTNDQRALACGGAFLFSVAVLIAVVHAARKDPNGR